MASKIFERIFSIRQELRPWLFFVIAYYFPAFLTGIINYYLSTLFPSIKIIYKIIKFNVDCIFGMLIYSIILSITLIILLLIKSNLNVRLYFNLKLFIYGAILPLILPIFEHIIPEHSFIKINHFSLYFFNIYSFLITIFWILQIGIINPLLEEILYRSILQDYFKEINGGIKSILLTSLAFTMPHIISKYFLYPNLFFLIFELLFIFFVSLLLCSVKEKTANLSFCISFHIANNILWALFTIAKNSERLPYEIKQIVFLNY